MNRLLRCILSWITCQVLIRAASALAGGPSNMSQSHLKPRIIPITIFSGFLGSGKTTLLQHLLHNNDGCRIAVIVNDVASMNIDSKLVSQQSSSQGRAAGIVQLQNGCACCSLSDELLGSVSELVTLSDLQGGYDEESAGFDHIVIELSGLADPKSVRAKFQEAILYDMPLMERVRLDTMVSLVDCSMFLDQLASTKLASPEETPELFYPDGVKPEAMEDEEEFNDEDFPPLLLEALVAGERKYGTGDFNAREQDATVVDLLVSQCETADIVLLNKKDLATPQDMKRIDSVVRALNPRARVSESEFGRLPLSQILAIAKGRGVAQAGIVDDHKDFVQAAAGTRNEVQAHEHSHLHDAATKGAAELNGSLGQSDGRTHNHDCNDPQCVDESHSHDHSHTSNKHCTDADCTDSSHSHEHEHAHGNLGTYVYRSRRPFHPGRLVGFLRNLSLKRGLPYTEPTSHEPHELHLSTEGRRLLKGILRSKGFVWCADSNEAAMFWSHAGTSFELCCLGRWWATLDRSQWPMEAVKTILQDFDSADHDESDPAFKTVGDRRQEIVFIGPELNSAASQAVLEEALSRCLLRDDEWSSYCTNRNDEVTLRKAFANPLQVKMMTS